MVIDVHAHYVPSQSLNVACQVGQRYGLKLEKNERGRDMVTRAGKAILTSLRRSSPTSIYVCRSWTSRVSICRRFPGEHVLFLLMAEERSNSPAGSTSAAPKRWPCTAPFCRPGFRKQCKTAAAAAELERAMTRLGLRGFEIGSNINGR
jgi:hypothetical protein